MSEHSAHQQRLISQIVLTSHVYTFCYLSVMAAASCVMFYYTGNLIQTLLDIAVIVTLLLGYRIRFSYIAKHKAYPFEQGKTSGSNCNETILKISSALSLKPPPLYLSPQQGRNACCSLTGGFSWFLMVSEGLAGADDSQIQSLIAHELGHRKCLHSIWVMVSTALMLMLALSTEGLCEAKGISFFFTVPIVALTLALTLLLVCAFSRQQEFQADAIATVLHGKKGMINNLLEIRLPPLAAIGHHFQPHISQEWFLEHFQTRPDRLALVLQMESAMDDDRRAKGLLARMQTLKRKLLTQHPPLVQRVKNMERFETLAGKGDDFISEKSI